MENRDQLLIDIGLDPGYTSVPDRAYDHANNSGTEEGFRSWAGRSIRHMAAVLRGRSTDEDGVANVARALRAADPDLPSNLMSTREFVPLEKAAVEKALGKLQSHWSPLHAVQLWDRLGLSRRAMETLRHLLSYIYDPIADRYRAMVLWASPFKESDVLTAPHLAPRNKREDKFKELVGEQHVEVSLAGNCQRDFGKVTERTYRLWSHAMRSNFTDSRPAQPVLYLDATGAMLGRGVTHTTVGSADFRDCKQSRRTLGPLGLYEGSDKAMPLREHCDLILDGFNSMVERGTLSVNGRDVPCRPLTAADMQGAKALAGMTSASHSVWCKCGRANQHNYPKEAVSSVDEMMAKIKEHGCEFKTLEEQVRWAHWSWGVWKGGAFTRIKCECGYDPSEAQWRRDVAEVQGMSDTELKDAYAVHNETGKYRNMEGICPEGEEEEFTADAPPKVHHDQLLHMPPGAKIPMWRAGVDQLHLISLNLFKHLFMHTIHKNLQLPKKKLIRAYFRAAGFYSYDAEVAEEESPVQRWIGREVKRFLEQAHIHLPFLLRIAAAPAEIIAEADAPPTNDAGEIELEDESDEELQPTEQEVNREEELEPEMMKAATYWDNFLALVDDIHKPWEGDSDEERGRRAVSAFNHGCQVANDLLELNPEMQSWVPHILCFIVPRQILWLGEPAKRACDACESFGAMVKKIIKHLTCRRNIASGSAHTGKIKKKAWKQTFNKSYIQQAFERVAVRETLIHGEENAPYLQREDAALLARGMVNEKSCKEVDGRDTTLRELIDAPTVPTKAQTMALDA